jgi:hypothetical protein
VNAANGNMRGSGEISGEREEPHPPANVNASAQSGGVLEEKNPSQSSSAKGKTQQPTQRLI